MGRNARQRTKDEAEYYRYLEQQNFLAYLAVELGFIYYCPDYHGATGDANTVLFYTKEDDAHNRKVDMELTRYTRSEASDLRKYCNMHIADKYVYRDHFWWFENTDINGVITYDFANHGKYDLRRSDWKRYMEGDIRMAFALKKQRDYLQHTGGLYEVRESDEYYNDLNREILYGFMLANKEAYIGNINYYGADRTRIINGESVYESYTDGHKICNFGCSFCVSCKDEKLDSLVREWNTTGNVDLVEKITARVEEIGGKMFVWF